MELLLDQKVSSFLVQISCRAGLTVVNPRRLAEDSAFSARLDLKSELLIGFPYTLAHAEALASVCARLLAPPARKKGIITDLDDTLWAGIVGEVGPEGVSWDLSQHQHLHALYQNLLSSLADGGVLVGVASKNDAGHRGESVPTGRYTPKRRRKSSLSRFTGAPNQNRWNAFWKRGTSQPTA